MLERIIVDIYRTAILNRSHDNVLAIFSDYQIEKTAPVLRVTVHQDVFC